MLRSTLILALAGAALSLPSIASAAAPSGTFVGEAGGTAVAVVVDPTGVQAYVCDGKRVGLWLTGRRLGTLRWGRRSLTLAAKGKGVRATFAGRSATLRRATGVQGLFRSESSSRKGRSLGGWIVLSKSRQVGVVTGAGGTLTAPKLSTATLAAGSSVAGQVVSAAGTQLVAVDAAGDGLSISSRVTTGLAGAGAKSLALPRAASDDAILVVDTAVLKRAGYTLRSATGALLSGAVTVTGGLRVTSPAGVTTTAVSGFHLLRLLAASDGRLNLLSGAGAALQAREDRRESRIEAEVKLVSLEAKIEQDNAAISQGMAEAREKAQLAMEAATTSLVTGIVSAGIQIGSAVAAGTATETSTITITLPFPPPPRKVTIRLFGYVAD
jgi:hypothetical protein